MARHVLKILGGGLLALLFLLVLIVGSSWLYFEPHSKPKDEAKTSDTPHYLTERLKETLDPAKGEGIKLNFMIQFRDKPDKQWRYKRASA